MFGNRRSWQVPPADAPESARIGWQDEACQDGAAWNQSQPGYDDWKRSIEVLNGYEASTRDATQFRSYLSGRRLKTNIRTAISGLSNIRPMWGYHSARQYEKFAQMMNKTSRALYLEGFWDRDIKDLVSFAAATNTGWIRPTYWRDRAGAGQGRIKLFTYGQPCVLPVQMPSSGDYQQAYAVNLMDEMPIFEAHSRWPLYQDRIQPTKSALWYNSTIRQAAEGNQRKKAPFNPFRRRDQGNNLSNLYVAIRYTTIIDNSYNETDYTVPMGQAGTPWYYEVPPLKDCLDNPDKARLYPYRRLMISSEQCIMYDGPAFNWHGQLDLIPLTVDRWPWAPMGFSMVHDGYNIEKNANTLDRGMMDRLKAQNNLPLAYDLNAVTKNEAESFDPLDPDNNRVGFDGSEVETPFQFPIPLEWYRITPDMLQFRESLKEDLDYTLQIRDVVELSKARVLGKDLDSIEKVLSALGPIVKDIGRSMEQTLGAVGMQVGWLILQYMTTKRIIEYIGPEATVPEMFDYNPQDLYPSHLPDEQVHGSDESVVSSKYTSLERARWMAEQLRFFIMPNSLHEVHQMTQVLMMMQMKQRGMAISDYSVMSAANIPDVVAPEGNSEQQRWESEQQDRVLFQARMAVIAKTVGMEEGLIPGQPNPPTPAEALAGAPTNGSTPQGGRPPTGQVPPHLEVKDGMRPTIAESA